MGLPDQLELLKLFSAFLSEAGLSSVSIKNYLSDIRNFLAYCAARLNRETISVVTVKDIFQKIDPYLEGYLDTQKANFTPQSTTSRRLASIRRFSTFLHSKFGITNLFTDQNISKPVTSNNFFVSDQNISPLPSTPETAQTKQLNSTSTLSTKKILDQFKYSLEKEKKSHSTVKNYLSDLNHFFQWTANQTPFTDQNLVNILSEDLLSTYVTYLKLSHTSTSVTNRRQSSIKKLTKFSFEEGYLPVNPFELKPIAPKLAPLAWLERLTKKRTEAKTEVKQNKLTKAYHAYNSLPWTPYFNLALLVIATTAMAIFAYNQIISGARPSSAASALTPPKRQLSFQGRLTDTGGTPITTAVNVVFKLFNNLTGPTQLYSSGTCSITPDQDGIFNTLIGDGVCGSEINSSVFTDNRDVFLELGVGAETLSPRQQIATVGFALNSETLQGYPASAAATINTVPVMDNFGRIVLAETNPSIIATSSSGTFTIKGDSLAFKTNDNSGGDIIIQPDALGSGQILALGGTTTEDTFRITNANLTSGSLISGYIGNDTATGRLISLTSGSTETDRFWVAADGRTSIISDATNSALIINQNGSGNLISASSSGTPKFTVTNGGNVNIAGQYLINGVPLIGSYWQRTSGSLAPINVTDSINLGATATGSALVHLAGTSGENSFVNTGNFGVGTNSPGYKLDVNGDANFSSAIRAGGNAGTAGFLLTSSGGGVNTWTDPASFGAGSSLWQRTSGSIAPQYITDSVNIGATATGSALVHLAGTSGENSFVNTGNFGIGLTNPSEKLDVSGNINFTGALMPGGAPGVAGQYLVSGGSGVSPTWTSSVAASSVPFSGITASTNTGNALLVGAGSSLDFTGGGTINASSLLGATWASPGTIGSTTPNTGAFTTLSASGLVSANSGINVTGYATVSASLAVGYANAPGAPGDGVFSGYVGIGINNPAYALDVDGDLNLTGAINNNGDPGTPGQILSSTGTGFQWIAAPTGGNNSPWDWSAGVISPFIISDAVNLGNSATASATVHLAGKSGDDSFVNTGNFGVGLTNPAYKLDVNGDINLSGGIRASSSFGSPGDVLTSTGAGLQWVASSSVGSGSNWTIGSGAIFPNILSLDLLLGGNSTASAKFAFINVDSGTPTASISSQTANLNTYLTGDGTLATTNRNSLTIGNSGSYDTTGNVLVNPNGTGNLGVGLSNPSYKLDVSGTAHVTGNVTLDSLTANRLVVTDGSKNLTSSISSANLASSITDETGTLNAVFSDAPTFTSNITTPVVLGGAAAGSSLSLQSTSGSGTTDYINFKVGNNGGTEAMRITNSGSIGAGTATPLAKLDIRGNLGTTPVASISGATNQPALLVDQSGTGDIFNASSSGQTRFRITNNGSIYTSLGLGIVRSSAAGLLSSGNLDLATEVTGILPILNGGTNNSTYTSGKFLAYDGTKIASTAFDATSFEVPLTFSNGLTRTVNSVTWGGTLTGATTIAQAGFDVAFTGLGNFGIGTALPSQKLDVAGVFVVDAANGRVGIGTTTPTTALDIAGTTSTISNSSGDITLNAASGFLNFSGNSLNNFLDATLSGRLHLGGYPTVGLPSAIAGMLVYDTTANYPTYYDGTGWRNMGSYFTRTSNGIIYPTVANDSIHVGGTPSASSSALIRLSSNDSFNSYFYNPVGFGFRSTLVSGANTWIESEGDISPHTDTTWNLGSATYQWQNLNLGNGIFYGGTETVAVNTYRLTGGIPWAAITGLRVGDGGSPVVNNALPSGIQLYVNGGATISGTLGVVGNTSLIGNVTIGGGTGKIDVGTVDPPYTINGEKYATYMTSMIGVKEEVMGKVATTEYVNGLGYRTILDFNSQPKGSDLWLFSKTTNLKSNLNQLSVLLTASGQAKTWYEIDEANKLLAIYSSTPTNIIYRLTAPRFDAANWTNTRTSESIGFVINNPDINEITPGTGLLGATVNPELIAQIDGTYKVNINGTENKEVSSFFQSIIANLQVGAQTVSSLIADNLTIRTKLVSPIADIDQLRTTDATISGTLYADNIKSKTVDTLTEQLNLLNDKYSTASAILADLQAKYPSYDSLLGNFSAATLSGSLASGSDPLALSPLATTSAIIPSDLALDSLNVHTIYSNDIIANGSIFAQSYSSFGSDLFIQPAGDRPVHLLANLMTLYPDGKVVINGDLLVTGTIYSMGLDTKTATVSGTLAVGSSTIASESASFAQLTTSGLVIASGNDQTSATISAQTNSNTTIGTATIATGSAEINIANTKVTGNTLIYITPISDTSNQVLYVKSKETGVGFTVAVPTILTNQVSFNYWLVETK